MVRRKRPNPYRLRMTQQRDANRLLVVAAFAAVYVIWGSTYLAIRLAVGTIPALLMASCRFLLAGALMLAFTWNRRGTVRRVEVRTTAVVGVLLLLGGNGGVSFGEQFVPSAVAALLVATVPLWMAMLGGAILGERTGGRRWAGVAVGLAGTALLLRPGNPGTEHLPDMLVVLASPLCWASGSLYAKRAPLPRNPLFGTGMEMLIGGIALGIAAVATGDLGRLHLSQISLTSGLAFAYLVIFGSLLAFTAYSWLLGKVSVAAAGTYAFVNPVVAVVLGWAFDAETITPFTLLAMVLIVVAVAAIVAPHRGDHPRRRRDLPVAEVA